MEFCGFGETFMALDDRIDQNPPIKTLILLRVCIVSESRCLVNKVQSKKAAIRKEW